MLFQAHHLKLSRLTLMLDEGCEGCLTLMMYGRAKPTGSVG